MLLILSLDETGLKANSCIPLLSVGSIAHELKNNNDKDLVLPSDKVLVSLLLLQMLLVIF